MNKNFYYFSLFGQLGITVVLNLFIFIGVFKLIEKILKMNENWIILFILLGLVSGIYSCYKLIFRK